MRDECTPYRRSLQALMAFAWVPLVPLSCAVHESPRGAVISDDDAQAFLLNARLENPVDLIRSVTGEMFINGTTSSTLLIAGATSEDLCRQLKIPELPPTIAVLDSTKKLSTSVRYQGRCTYLILPIQTTHPSRSCRVASVIIKDQSGVGGGTTTEGTATYDGHRWSVDWISVQTHL